MGYVIKTGLNEKLLENKEKHPYKPITIED